MTSDLISELLELDDSNFNVEKTDEIEVDRLTKAIGKPFIVKVKSLTPQRIYELNGRSFDSQGALDLGNYYKGNLNICSEAIVSPDFNNSSLKEKLKINERAIKQDVIAKVFRVDEITAISQAVIDISGFHSFNDGKDLSEQLKKD